MFKVLGVDHIGIAVGDLQEVGSFGAICSVYRTMAKKPLKNRK